MAAGCAGQAGGGQGQDRSGSTLAQLELVVVELLDVVGAARFQRPAAAACGNRDGQVAQLDEAVCALGAVRCRRRRNVVIGVGVGSALDGAEGQCGLVEVGRGSGTLHGGQGRAGGVGAFGVQAQRGAVQRRDGARHAVDGDGLVGGKAVVGPAAAVLAHDAVLHRVLRRGACERRAAGEELEGLGHACGVDVAQRLAAGAQGERAAADRQHRVAAVGVAAAGVADGQRVAGAEATGGPAQAVVAHDLHRAAVVAHEVHAQVVEHVVAPERDLVGVDTRHPVVAPVHKPAQHHAAVQRVAHDVAGDQAMRTQLEVGVGEDDVVGAVVVDQLDGAVVVGAVAVDVDVDIGEVQRLGRDVAHRLAIVEAVGAAVDGGAADMGRREAHQHRRGRGQQADAALVHHLHVVVGAGAQAHAGGAFLGVDHLLAVGEVVRAVEGDEIEVGVHAAGAALEHRAEGDGALAAVDDVVFAAHIAHAAHQAQRGQQCGAAVQFNGGAGGQAVVAHAQRVAAAVGRGHGVVGPVGVGHGGRIVDGDDVHVQPGHDHRAVGEVGRDLGFDLDDGLRTAHAHQALGHALGVGVGLGVGAGADRDRAVDENGGRARQVGLDHGRGRGAGVVLAGAPVADGDQTARRRAGVGQGVVGRRGSDREVQATCGAVRPGHITPDVAVDVAAGHGAGAGRAHAHQAGGVADGPGRGRAGRQRADHDAAHGVQGGAVGHIGVEVGRVAGVGIGAADTHQAARGGRGRGDGAGAVDELLRRAAGVVVVVGAHADAAAGHQGTAAHRGRVHHRGRARLGLDGGRGVGPGHGEAQTDRGGAAGGGGRGTGRLRGADVDAAAGLQRLPGIAADVGLDRGRDAGRGIGLDDTDGDEAHRQRSALGRGAAAAGVQGIDSDISTDVQGHRIGIGAGGGVDGGRGLGAGARGRDQRREGAGRGRGRGGDGGRFGGADDEVGPAARGADAGVAGVGLHHAVDGVGGLGQAHRDRSAHADADRIRHRRRIGRDGGEVGGLHGDVASGRDALAGGVGDEGLDAAVDLVADVHRGHRDGHRDETDGRADGERADVGVDGGGGTGAHRDRGVAVHLGAVDGGAHVAGRLAQVHLLPQRAVAEVHARQPVAVGPRRPGQRSAPDALVHAAGVGALGHLDGLAHSHAGGVGGGGEGGRDGDVAAPADVVARHRAAHGHRARIAARTDRCRSGGDQGVDGGRVGGSDADRAFAAHAGAADVGRGAGLHDVDGLGAGAGQRRAAEEAHAHGDAGGRGGGVDGGQFLGVDADAVAAGADAAAAADVGLDLVGDLVPGDGHADGDGARDRADGGRQGGRLGAGGDERGVFGQDDDAADIDALVLVGHAGDAGPRPVAVDVRTHLGLDAVVRAGAGAGAAQGADAGGHGDAGGQHLGADGLRGLGADVQRAVGLHAAVLHIGLHLGGVGRAVEVPADQVLRLGHADGEGATHGARAQRAGQCADGGGDGGGVLRAHDDIPSVPAGGGGGGGADDGVVDIGPSLGADEVDDVDARTGQAHAGQARAGRRRGGHAQGADGGGLGGAHFHVAAARAHGLAVLGAVGDEGADAVLDLVAGQGQAHRHREARRADAHRHRGAAGEGIDDGRVLGLDTHGVGGDAACASGPVSQQRPGARNAGTDDGGHAVLRHRARAGQADAGISAGRGGHRRRSHGGVDGLHGRGGHGQVAAHVGAAVDQGGADAHGLVVVGVANEVAGDGHAHRQRAGAQAAQGHRRRCGDGLGVDGGGVVGFDAQVAQAVDRAALHIGQGRAQDDVAGVYAGTAEAEAHAAARQRHGHGHGLGVDGGVGIGVDEDVAGVAGGTHRHQPGVHAVDEGGHVGVHAVEAHAHAHRQRHAHGAHGGRHGHGAGEGLDARGVVGANGHRGGLDATVVQVAFDRSFHQGGDAVL